MSVYLLCNVNLPQQVFYHYMWYQNKPRKFAHTTNQLSVKISSLVVRSTAPPARKEQFTMVAFSFSLLWSIANQTKGNMDVIYFIQQINQKNGE